MALETKERSSKVKVSGNSRTPTGTVRNYSFESKDYHQRTGSQDNILFLFMMNQKKHPTMPRYWIDFMSRQDLGAAFRTEYGSIDSSLREIHERGSYSGTWTWDHLGPAFPVGFKEPLQLATSQEVVNQNQLMFALGGAAIARCRPGKPQVNLAVAIGELKKDGLPSLIGSMYSRVKNMRDVFRSSGSEYLNVQFGWVPLVKDLTGLARTVINTRELLQAHEKQLNKLLQRSYYFNDTINTVQGLSKPLSNYEFDPAIDNGMAFYCSTGANSGASGVSEITRTVTKSHFSGGFRFYYPEIDTALRDLQRIEEKANILLGTRLDPEILWNLAPWTWLVDWFINFGDVVGNLSAIVADGLVMQYGYIMHEVEIRKEIHYPRGLLRRDFPARPQQWSQKPWTVTQTFHSKSRARASPFGFGLSPEMFNSQQWAILAALGISRGLK